MAGWAWSQARSAAIGARPRAFGGVRRLGRGVQGRLAVQRGTHMEIIVPSRSTISERFPIASFNVRVPAARYFEVVCATDPRLFHTSYAGHRTPHNFYTSRSDGMLFSRAGEDTFFIPPQQLRR